MPDGICLKGQIRGQPPPKVVFFGGVDPPIDFQNFWTNLHENFFGTTSTYFQSRKKFSDPVEYSTKCDFFGKKRDF